MVSGRSVIESLVDSGILITALRGDERAKELLAFLRGRGPVACSAMTAFEVLRGAVTRNHERQARLILTPLEVVSIDLAVADTAAALVRRHPGIYSSERTLPDSLIAACAQERAYSLVTLNRRQFEQVDEPDLHVILIDQNAADWTAGIP